MKQPMVEREGVVRSMCSSLATIRTAVNGFRLRVHAECLVDSRRDLFVNVALGAGHETFALSGVVTIPAPVGGRTQGSGETFHGVPDGVLGPVHVEILGVEDSLGFLHKCHRKAIIYGSQLPFAWKIMNEESYAAIPTTYKGIKYRSRLEAKVAAFLDLCEIHYDYEPVDLKRYIPDFIIDLAEPTLLEVKPAVTPQEFKHACRRISKSGWRGPALVVGARLLIDADDRTDLTLYGSTHAELGGWAKVGRLKWPKPFGPYPFKDVRANWAVAQNTTQWVPRTQNNSAIG